MNSFQNLVSKSADYHPGSNTCHQKCRCVYKHTCILYDQHGNDQLTDIMGKKLVPRLSLRPAASIFAEGFFRPFFQSADRGVHVREDVERRHRHRAKLARAAGLPAAGGVRAVGAAPVAEHYGALERPRRCVGAHSRPQKRISEAKSHRTPVLWLFLWHKLFYAYLTP